jgi:hypothetical protein
MSPTMLAVLRRVELETRRLACQTFHDDDGTPIPDSARYPRDYHRPVELLWRWRGPGRFFYDTGSGC